MKTKTHSSLKSIKKKMKKINKKKFNSFNDKRIVINIDFKNRCETEKYYFSCLMGDRLPSRPLKNETAIANPDSITNVLH